MASEMHEQPGVVGRLISRCAEIDVLVTAVLPSSLRGVALLARGSSDNVAMHARYVIESCTGRPVSLVAPSLHTLYKIHADYSGWLVIAISQSGATPEIATVLHRLRSCGAATLAVTNDPTSRLARVAHAVLSLNAGDELAVPATKTVTAQLAALALIARTLAPGRAPFTDDDLTSLPGLLSGVLNDPDPINPVAQQIADARTIIAVARGYLYAAALEAALKIRETTGLPAEGWSAADLRHGPIAALTPDTVVLSLSARGPAAHDLDNLAADLRKRKVSPVLITDQPNATIPVPSTAEPLAILPMVVRAQQLALASARRLGTDPDTPFALTKVTAT